MSIHLARHGQTAYNHEGRFQDAGREIDLTKVSEVHVSSHDKLLCKGHTHALVPLPVRRRVNRKRHV